MKLKYLGHSSFQIRYNGCELLIDPFISANPLATDIDINSLSPDFILLTHGHQDHVLDAETIAKRSGAKIISNFEIVTWYANKGIEGHGLNHGGKFQFDFGWLKYVYAVHSSVLPDGTYGGNPGGFVLWNSDSSKDQKCVYIAGDTALNLDMKLIPKTCPEIDLAILPIGDNFTMSYEEAVLATQFVKTTQVIGCHYDTFPIIKIDHNLAKECFKRENITLNLLNIGDSLNL